MKPLELIKRLAKYRWPASIRNKITDYDYVAALGWDRYIEIAEIVDIEGRAYNKKQ